MSFLFLVIARVAILEYVDNLNLLHFWNIEGMKKYQLD